MQGCFSTIARPAAAAHQLVDRRLWCGLPDSLDSCLSCSPTHFRTCLFLFVVCVSLIQPNPSLDTPLVLPQLNRPEEYPASLQGLYSSSPDEALPQFYCDPSAFVSTHEGMRDLAVPGWARDAEDFVRLHRCAGVTCVCFEAVCCLQRLLR